ncbi:hypothetical protein HGP28_08710 [Vibrio sp. SM6]|uniref:Uncharacterized protein n=1 Tax=Vibrio agarilyticus TaxID=2726741 RepID=A0A7X8YGX0_9VIBR|nr:hypothetical protein [Vibrio agarilyticus]NLS12970.1 hypothetical protein [Vibrio agarilyticus]
MKFLALIFALALPLSVNASGGGSGGGSGIPIVPCYIDGEYQGSIEVTKCQAKGGKTYVDD